MYSEKVYPPPISWLLGALFGLAIGLVFGAPFGAIAGIISGALAAGLVTIGLWRSIYEITIDQHTLTVEGHRVERAHITNCKPLDRIAARRTLGPEADPASLVIMRGWVHTAVKVDISDPENRTPYLFISTRKANEIAELLNKKE